MLNSKTLLSYLLTLLVSVSMIACPDDCEEDGGAEAGAEAEAGDEAGAEECGGTDGGALGGDETPLGGDVAGAEGGAEGGAEVPAGPVYTTIFVLDTSTFVDDDGTPGADVCEVTVTCGDDSTVNTGTADVAADTGTSAACDGSNNGDSGCICRDAVSEGDVSCGGTDRGDKNLSFDGMSCDTPDNYTSVGLGGYLSYGFDGDLAGCTVSVEENGDNGNDESYTIYACTSAEWSEETCMEIGMSSTTGGNAQGTIPAAEAPSADEGGSEG
jgi:hypothetical protein